jgi:5-methylcytosine-specific restriction endonuclease McrA
VDLVQQLKNIEDYLFPKLGLDHVERVLYYHLFRHTRAIGKDASLFGLLSLAEASGISESTVRERIRALHEKGCIRIDDRSGKGHLLRVFLPEEVDGVVPKRSEVPTVDINEADFYTNRTHVNALVERENGQCFYCLRNINAEVCVLDHVISKMAQGGNSFRNVVACCHECNSAKQGQDASEFLRTRYRVGLLSQADLQERISALEKLQLGQLVPEI